MKNTPSKTAVRLKWTALGLVAVLGGVPAVKAQSNTDGAIAGSVAGDAKGTVVVQSLTTGLKRVATVGADGTYRITSLPPGKYNVAFTPASGTAGEAVEASVSIGSTATVDLGTGAIQLEKFVVSEGAVTPIDFGKTTQSLTFDKKTIDSLPVLRNSTAVALLTPGAVEGDNQFNLIGVGRLASFGGASVAENGYYVNGFNLTNFRNGLGGSNVPFDFYDQFEVIDGAYSARYGRSTGGVINGTTKRGTNEYKADVNVLWQPMGWKDPSVYYKDASGNGKVSIYNGEDYRDVQEGSIIASGPILKDKLFFAGIYQQTNIKSRGATGSGTNLVRDTINNPFYALKLDATPFAGQSLEYTFFSDKETTERKNFSYDFPTHTAAATPLSTPYFDRGGKNQIFAYKGVFFENLTIAANYGFGRFDRTNRSPQDSTPYVQDARGSLASSPRVLQGVASVVTAYDDRKAKRLDIGYDFDFLGHHEFKIGYDSESNTSFDETAYGGGERWRYVTTSGGKKVLGQVVPTGTTELVYRRIFKTGGSFKVDSDAYFVEDQWHLFKDRVLARIGVREESFENFNANNVSFFKIQNQISPRIGLGFDPIGDKKSKISVNYGRYYLPVATNTNIRLAGAQYDRQTYYFKGEGTNPNGTPVIGAQFADSIVSPGTVPDTSSIVSHNLKPMYQDEYVVGYERQLNKQWTVKVKGIYRDLGSSFDDAIVDHALTAYATKNNIKDEEGNILDQTDAFQYVLINPGSPVVMNWDFGDGVNRLVTLDAKDLRYPKAARKWLSAEFSAERVYDGRWTARFSYVWAHNYGNTEGLVLSDNGQTDAGITQQFDTPDLVVNTYGNLPNDRRHLFKAFGSYSVTREWDIGFNTYLSSGKPINRIGALENGDSIADFYGAAYLLVPRGSAGRTPWIFNADLAVTYKPAWAKNKNVETSFEFAVFNILNRHGVTAVDEYATTDELDTKYDYLTPTDFQTPRRIRFSAKLSF